ncbi:hypothetical protein UFOVP1004_8 [uncultured Caudovirales phage]|uniref:Uncharacterized protein n=1 Tax=uncultured Caudovirales phage TaxID=2100421 RepID=A0A6J5Q620_9CAUD|nr:hypothetical protein UFOVP1004_8 [uncultured Caudovirales phage]
MKKISIALCVCVIGWRVAGSCLPSVSAVGTSQTLTDECCEDLAKRLKAFQREGASKLKAGEFKAATDFESWSGAGWLAAEREAFKPLDEAEGHAVYADDWRAAFEKLWTGWGGAE